MNKPREEIASLPYAERRLIVIRPKVGAKDTKSKINWKDFDVSTMSGAAVGAAVAASMVVPLLGPAFLLGGYFFGGKKNDQEDSAIKGALIVDGELAKKQLLFSPGHPMPEHAYVGHPLVARQYIPYAAFHRFLFEEKVNELISLLASLGATRVRVVCRKGYTRASGADISIDASSHVAQGGASFSTAASGKDEAEFEEHYRPSEKPHIPDELVWYGHEASWQALAQRRLKNNMSKFKVVLHYEEDFGINAAFKVSLEKLGIGMGGKFNSFESTAWEFEGEFT